MTDVRIGLLGHGVWGRNHRRVLEERGVLGGVFDPNPAATLGLPSELRAPTEQALLERSEIRGVIVATPARSHEAVALRALEAGKDVLVEKPMTLDEGAGHRLVEAARVHRRVLMVGHVVLYHPAVEALLALIREGTLGRLRYLYANRLNFGTVREEEDILWSFAPHDLAMFLAALEALPDRVQVHGGHYLRPDRADVTVTHLEFRSGVQGHIFVSWLHPMKEHRFVVIGDRAMAVFVDGPSGGTLGLVHGVPPEPGCPTTIPRAEQQVPFVWAEPLKRQLDHFLQRMEDRAEPRTGGQHGLAVLRILEAARRSLLSRTAVSLAENRISEMGVD